MYVQFTNVRKNLLFEIAQPQKLLTFVPSELRVTQCDILIILLEFAYIYRCYCPSAFCLKLLGNYNTCIINNVIKSLLQYLFIAPTDFHFHVLPINAQSNPFFPHCFIFPGYFFYIFFYIMKIKCEKLNIVIYISGYTFSPMIHHQTTFHKFVYIMYVQTS